MRLFTRTKTSSPDKGSLTKDEAEFLYEAWGYLSEAMHAFSQMVTKDDALRDKVDAAFIGGLNASAILALTEVGKFLRNRVEHPR